MNIRSVIAKEVDNRGISVAELARRSEMKYEALRLFLVGQQDIKGESLVRVSKVLGLEMDDFDEA